MSHVFATYMTCPTCKGRGHIDTYEGPAVGGAPSLEGEECPECDGAEVVDAAPYTLEDTL